jgi:hypothetical protein
MASNFRPYYPRVQNRPQQSDDVTRGMAIGSAFGKDIQGLGTALAQGIAQQKQNQVANQLLNQNYPDTPADPNLDPGADLSTDLPEDVSTDIGGGASPGQQGNFQGGAAELAMRMQAAKESLGLQNLQSEIAQRNAAAKLSGQKAAGGGGGGVRLGGGSSSRWLTGNTGQTGQTGARGPRGGGPGKPAPYVAGSGDTENDESTDNFSQIRADFDDQHGKGSFDAFQAQNGGTKNADGSFSINDKNGNPIATVQAADVPQWMQRVNAARIKRNQQPIGSLGTGQNPTSNAPAGTASNPVVAQSPLHVRSLPFGTVVYDPNTKQTYTKQKPPAQ